jgi:hypothetical protein
MEPRFIRSDVRASCWTWIGIPLGVDRVSAAASASLDGAVDDPRRQSHSLGEQEADVERIVREVARSVFPVTGANHRQRHHTSQVPSHTGTLRKVPTPANGLMVLVPAGTNGPAERTSHVPSRNAAMGSVRMTRRAGR